MKTTGGIYHLKATLLSLLMIVLFGTPANGQSTSLTSRQATYIIGAIGAVYALIFVVIFILTCCLCTRRNKGRVCPISQNEKRHPYAEVNVNKNPARYMSHLKPDNDLSAKVSEETVDLADYPDDTSYQNTTNYRDTKSSHINPSYMSTTDIGKTLNNKPTNNQTYSTIQEETNTRGSTITEIKSENKPKWSKKLSTATVISNTDTIDDEEDSSDNSVTEI